MSTEADTQAMLDNPKFQKLVRTRSSLGWTLAAIMFVVYFGFILLVAFNKTDGQILSQKVWGTTTLAIVAGMAILVFTFVITAFYVVIANSSFDRLIREIRAETGK